MEKPEMSDNPFDDLFKACDDALEDIDAAILTATDLKTIPKWSNPMRVALAMCRWHNENRPAIDPGLAEEIKKFSL